MALFPAMPRLKQLLLPLLVSPLLAAPLLPGASLEAAPGADENRTAVQASSAGASIPELYPYFAAAARSAGTPVYIDAAHSARAATLSAGEEYPVLALESGQAKLQLLGGKTGYVELDTVNLRPLKRYVLGWNAYADRATFLAQNLASAELNVVSPRWFFLDQKNGGITAAPDSAYVAASHQQGQEAWPLFGNRFDSSLTSAFLRSDSLRSQSIAKLLSSLLDSGADGINVDFEKIAPEDKALYAAFISELAAALHPHGLRVSVDITRTNPDPYWSGSLDRAALGRAADFLVLMGYDEHYEEAPTAGSTSSLPWDREGVRLLLEEVPAQKVILGVPFYTRHWTTSAQGVVDSTYLSASDAIALVSKLGLSRIWDAAAEQNMVRYTDSGTVHQIWLEDANSMKRRTALVPQYALRGTAAWYMGQETADMWPAFAGLVPAKPLRTAPDYADLAGHWARESVLALAQSRVIAGTGEGKFEPDRLVTRAEFAALLSRLYIGGSPIPSSQTSRFRDVPAKSWYLGSAELLAGLNVLDGYPDGTFRPQAAITREEMAAMINRLMHRPVSLAELSVSRQTALLQPFFDADSLTWSRQAVAEAIDRGIVKGRSADRFAPGSFTTRAEAAVMLERLQTWLAAQPGYELNGAGSSGGQGPTSPAPATQSRATE
jgi:spore germination protein